jgi:hypothetical protein
VSSEPESERRAEKAGESSSAEDRAVRRRVRRALAEDGDDVVPKLPRGRGFKIGSGHMLKIILTASLLAILIVVQRPCAESVSGFVTSFDDHGSAAAQMPKPGKVDKPGSGSAEHYELIHPGMTPDEERAAIERELNRAKNANNGSGSGSGARDR